MIFKKIKILLGSAYFANELPMNSEPIGSGMIELIAGEMVKCRMPLLWSNKSNLLK